MRDILLINPNTSAATTAMMVAIAEAALPAGFRVLGLTAQRGAPMIVDQAELDASAFEVGRCWQRAGTAWAGVIVSAFGDPGLAALRASSAVPVAGLCEASMLEASSHGRRFGIATVTPGLVAAIDAKAEALGLGSRYTGIRLTQGDPRALAADPQALEAALATAVEQCIEADGAEAVIIGGGPLGQAAAALATRFGVNVIAPIPAAVRSLLASLEAGQLARP